MDDKQTLDQIISNYISTLSVSNDNVVEITSAYLLNPEEIGRIRNSLPSLKNIPVKNIVKKEIIAGLVIKINSLVVDLSFTTKLKKLYKTLI